MITCTCIYVHSTFLYDLQFDYLKTLTCCDSANERLEGAIDGRKIL